MLILKRRVGGVVPTSEGMEIRSLEVTADEVRLVLSTGQQVTLLREEWDRLSKTFTWGSGDPLEMRTQ